jgi:hypothetical protein
VEAVIVALADDSIDRILGHVGSEHVPSTLDRLELQKDILSAWDFYQGFKREDAKRANTQRRKYAEKIRKAAQTLSHLLADQSLESKYVRRIIARRMAMPEWNEGGNDPSLEALTRGLMKLETHAEAIVRQCSGHSSMREVVGMTPTFWFIGHDLAEIFEKHFKKKADQTRIAGALESAFVRFATTVTAELGEPFVDETMSKALSAARAWNQPN